MQILDIDRFFDEGRLFVDIGRGELVGQVESRAEDLRQRVIRQKIQAGGARRPNPLEIKREPHAGIVVAGRLFQRRAVIFADDAGFRRVRGGCRCTVGGKIQGFR